MTGRHLPESKRDTKWMVAAACKGTPTAVFFPELVKGHSDSNDEAWDKAKAICAGCPVKQQCLEYAMANETQQQRDGVYGGTTPKERKRIARTRVVARRATSTHFNCGHERSPENTYTAKTNPTGRCRQCLLARYKKRIS